MLVMFKDHDGHDVAIDSDDVSAVEQSGEFVKVTLTEARDIYKGMNAAAAPSKTVFLGGTTVAEAMASLNGAGA